MFFVPMERSITDGKSMKLSMAGTIEIPKEKITDYLLSKTHWDGRHKAAFFRAFGFTVEAWDLLVNALHKHVADHEVVKKENSPFGIRYVVEGKMEVPDGRAPTVRSVWFIGTGEDVLRLVTAYPL